MDAPTPDCLDDTAATAFVAGLMSSVELERVEEHLDRCPACRSHLAHLVRVRTRDGSTAATPPRALLAPGATVGKYRIVGVLGVGAMGVVYAAHDPQLQRDIALKMLRAHADQDRLQQEALALARLRHPNVVTVHEVGTDGGRVFIAMELVRGVTLGTWLEQPRRRQDIVAVFAQAGRGLQAAHAAGLVHRDFKPDNVLVGDDGRVCVTDFGLARAHDPAKPTTIESKVDKSTVDKSTVDLTTVGLTGGLTADSSTADSSTFEVRTHALVGTPAYMAPEQHLGKRADARSDQFAFCVALFEALHGARPFSGANLAELAKRVTSGSPPPSLRVPGRLARAITRGLATDPEKRHTSMAALVAELEAGQRSRARTTIVVGAVAVALVVVAGGAYLRGRGTRAQICGEGQLAKVWNPERRATVAAAFTKSTAGSTGSSGSSGGANTDKLAIASAELDRYTERWRAISTEVCEPARPEQAGVRAQQRRCLERRLREVDTLARLFSQGDAAVIARAPEAVYALSSVEECADAAASAQLVRPPREPAATAALERLENQLTEARAFEDAGRYSDGIARTLPLLAEAQQRHERGAEAEAALQLGRLYFRAADFPAAERQLAASVLAAEAGQRDELRAAALSKQVLLVGVRLRRLAEGQELAKRADAVVERLAGTPRLKTELLYSEALLAGSLGNYSSAADRYRQALATVGGADVDPTLTASLHDGLGMTLYDLGKYQEGLAELERGLQARERLFGPRHMTVSFSLNNIAVTQLALDHPAEAVPRATRALQIAEATVGAQHPDVAASLQILADAEASLGDPKAAEAHFRRALAIMEKTFGPESPNLTNALSGIVRVAVKQHRYPEAQTAQERVVHNKEKALGPTHPELATAYDGLAHLANKKGDYATAIRHCEHALSLRRPESDQETLASIHINLGYANLKLGQTTRAISSLTQATQLLAAHGEESSDLAEARFDLAEALWPSDRARAVSLATQALHAWSAPSQLEERTEAETWLRGHRVRK